jgi:hypothetical protein
VWGSDFRGQVTLWTCVVGWSYLRFFVIRGGKGLEF